MRCTHRIQPFKSERQATKHNYTRKRATHRTVMQKQERERMEGYTGPPDLPSRPLLRSTNCSSVARPAPEKSLHKRNPQSYAELTSVDISGTNTGFVAGRRETRKPGLNRGTCELEHAHDKHHNGCNMNPAIYMLSLIHI